MTTWYVSDIFNEAMSKIGAKAIDELPTPGEYNKCLRNANAMLASWSTQKLMLRGMVTESFPLIANQASYTIGIGGNFNTAKPITIEDAFIRDQANQDYGVEIVTQEEWDSYPDKAITPARPEKLFYDPGMSQQTSPNMGTINLYTMPDLGPYMLWLISDKYLTSFVNLTDLVTFEEAYDEALVYNLAIRIFSDFFGNTREIPKAVVALAKSSKKNIERLNSRAIIGKIDVPSSKQGATYDVYADRFI